MYSSHVVVHSRGGGHLRNRRDQSVPELRLDKYTSSSVGREGPIRVDFEMRGVLEQSERCDEDIVSRTWDISATSVR